MKMKQRIAARRGDAARGASNQLMAPSAWRVPWCLGSACRADHGVCQRVYRAMRLLRHLFCGWRFLVDSSGKPYRLPYSLCGVTGAQDLCLLRAHILLPAAQDRHAVKASLRELLFPRDLLLHLSHAKPAWRTLRDRKLIKWVGFFLKRRIRLAGAVVTGLRLLTT